MPAPASSILKSIGNKLKIMFLKKYLIFNFFQNVHGIQECKSISRNRRFCSGGFDSKWGSFVQVRSPFLIFYLQDNSRSHMVKRDSEAINTLTIAKSVNWDANKIPLKYKESDIFEKPKNH